jgi:hypothetical protein
MAIVIADYLFNAEFVMEPAAETGGISLKPGLLLSQKLNIPEPDRRHETVPVKPACGISFAGTFQLEKKFVILQE